MSDHKAWAGEAALVDKSKLIEALGEPRAEMIERLDLIHARTHPGPWRAYQEGVHPIDVGMAGSGDDYAICGACFGPRSGYHQLWICASHNDWPMIRGCLEELAGLRARAALSKEKNDGAT